MRTILKKVFQSNIKTLNDTQSLATDNYDKALDALLKACLLYTSERTLQVLDYAVLVISGTDGVQGHTQTLWRLLARYKIPAFLFVNKMDLAGERKEAILEELTRKLDGNIVDFGEQGTEGFYENLAMCGEAALDQFLENGRCV